MNCKKCGQEIMEGAVVCTSCGCKIKKPIYKKWWFWVIIVIVAIAIGSSAGSGDSKSSSTSSTKNNAPSETKAEIVYEKVDLKTMVNDLKSNALKAEKTYQDKYVEVSGKISNFDSDGSYISIEPTNADAFDFTSVMCYIKNDEQENYLLEKSKGDVVTIKGKIKSIGEVLGYSIDISEVN